MSAFPKTIKTGIVLCHTPFRVSDFVRGILKRDLNSPSSATGVNPLAKILKRIAEGKIFVSLLEPALCQILHALAVCVETFRFGGEDRG